MPLPPVVDGIFDNTPALQHSITPWKEHVAAEPLLSVLAMRIRFYELNECHV